MRRWLRLIVVLIPLCLLLAACGNRSGAPALPDEPPGVTGSITQIAADDQGRPRLLVGKSPEAGIPGLAWVTLTEKTVVLGATDEGYQRLAAADLTVGKSVKVWFDGPVLKSLPLQGAGLYIVVSEQEE